MLDQPARTDITEHSIVIESADPIRQPPYQVYHAYRYQVAKEMERSAIIEFSDSNWVSPMILVKKKDDTLRMYVDFRRVNAVSQVDPYPMPRIDDLIDQVGGAAFLTTLDLTKGYWQVAMAEGDRVKTAFTTPFGLYRYQVMPFRLQGAPATFQRLMDKVLRGLSSLSAAYLDDIMIHSRTWEDHLFHVWAVLKDMLLAMVWSALNNPRSRQLSSSQDLQLKRTFTNSWV